MLFLKAATGVELDEALKNRMKKTIMENTTPRHVRALILPVTNISVTLNGNKVEMAVRNVIEGKPATNRDAPLNPEALELFANIAELKA